jgi:hypothetical protein
MKLLVPTGRAPEELATGTRLVASWSGARIGFLDNGKPNARELLHLFDSRLQDALPLRPGHHERRSPIRPADPDMLERFRETCQGVVIASAD